MEKRYTVVVDNSAIYWFKEGSTIRHREDGPAIEYVNGAKCWYLNGKLHRNDGPAFEYPNGDKAWYIDDKLHREDGPAFEYANGNRVWYLNGNKYSERAYKTTIDIWKSKSTTDSCDGKMVEMDGKKYKLTLVK